MEKEGNKPNYFYVFIILAVLTGVETLISYMQQQAIKVPTLVLISAVKGLLVLLYFMHLKTDSRIYSYLFIAGCLLSIPLILIIVIVMPTLS